MPVPPTTNSATQNAARCCDWLPSTRLRAHQSGATCHPRQEKRAPNVNYSIEERQTSDARTRPPPHFRQSGATCHRLRRRCVAEVDRRLERKRTRLEDRLDHLQTDQRNTGCSHTDQTRTARRDTGRRDRRIHRWDSRDNRSSQGKVRANTAREPQSLRRRRDIHPGPSLCPSLGHNPRSLHESRHTLGRLSRRGILRRQNRRGIRLHRLHGIRLHRHRESRLRHHGRLCRGPESMGTRPMPVSTTGQCSVCPYAPPG